MIQMDAGGPDPFAERPKKKSRVGCVVWPVVILLLALGAGGYLGWRYLRKQRASLREARTELREARQKLRKSSKGAVAALTAREAEWAAERAKLQSDLAGARGRAEEADAVRQRLQGALGQGEGEVATEGGRVTLQLVDRVLFRSGEADLTPGGIRVLARVGEALEALPNNQVWVQGHTDDQRIRDLTKFASNWELASARALSVVHYLQDQAGIDPRRLAAVGFSQYRPLGPNRAKNRRIEIVLFPSEVRLVGATKAPAKAP